MTTLETIKTELAANNISTTGINEKLPILIFNVCENAQVIGLDEALKQTSIGTVAKMIVKKLVA